MRLLLPCLLLLVLAPACGERIPPDLADCYRRARLTAEREPAGALVEARLRRECEARYGR